MKTTLKKVTSKKTSVNKNKVPKVFTLVDRYFGWKLGQVNLDMGGGQYDIATKYLSRRKAFNMIYDPYNRIALQNMYIVRYFKNKKADTATISNVLNVVRTKKEMQEILTFVHSCLKDEGKCYITCYKAPKKGLSKDDCYQQAEPLEYYMPLVKKVFGNVTKKYGMLIAEKEVSNG